MIYDLGFVVFFLAKLFFLHIFLSANNITFYEYIKEKWGKLGWGNPYDR